MKILGYMLGTLIMALSASSIGVFPGLIVGVLVSTFVNTVFFSATPSGMPTSTGENTNFEQPPLNLSDAETQFKLGQAHRLGVGVPRSFEQAFAWIQKSVGKGFAEAQNMLGFMYSRGEGTPQSLMKLLGTEGSNITFEGYASLTQPQNDCSERRMDIGLYKTNNNTPRPLICRRLAQTLGLTLLDLTLV